MREPKYRAWDKSLKKMVKVSSIYFPNENNKNMYINNIQCNTPLPFELLEYTGLKDDKGIEICEGDIIKHNFIGKEEFIAITNENFYEARSYIESIINSIIEMQKQLFCYVEVVGNIYENKELLEELT